MLDGKTYTLGVERPDGIGQVEPQTRHLGCRTRRGRCARSARTYDVGVDVARAVAVAAAVHLVGRQLQKRRREELVVGEREVERRALLVVLVKPVVLLREALVDPRHHGILRARRLHELIEQCAVVALDRDEYLSRALLRGVVARDGHAHRVLACGVALLLPGGYGDHIRFVGLERVGIRRLEGDGDVGLRHRTVGYVVGGDYDALDILLLLVGLLVLLARSEARVRLPPSPSSQERRPCGAALP